MSTSSRRLSTLVLIALFSPMFLVPSPTLAADANTDGINACVKPGQWVRTGMTTGHDTAAIIQCNGGSSAGSSVKFYINFGPQVGGTVYAGEVFGGSDTNVFFYGGSAYVTSSLHSTNTEDSSSCVQCYTVMLVQRVSARETAEAPGPLLVDHGIDIIQLSASSDYKHQARDGYFKATQFFDRRKFQSKDSLKSA